MSKETTTQIKTIEEYRALYERSIKDPETFWGELADHLHWYRKWDKVLDYDFGEAKINWFKGGKLNVSDNCLDRHLNSRRKNKVALIWQGELPEENRLFTYQQLHYHVCKFASVLKKFGVRKGDRVSLYLPMVPELPIAMLACARIGAIHSVICEGLGYQALRDRINDSGSKVLITVDGYRREGDIVRTKAGADEALKDCPKVEKVIVVKRLGIDVSFVKGRDSWWQEEMAKEDLKLESEPEVMDAEDPLFILYTAGNTERPRGVVHTTGGYLLFVLETLKWVFNLKDEDIFFCTADMGGVVGHSYVIYGPLALGATTLMFEGATAHPNPGRIREIVQRHNVSIHVDREKIMETWSQTESGGFLISSLPIPKAKPGSAARPLPGVVPKILREDGTECDIDEAGFLVMAKSWPGMARGLWDDSEGEGLKETYFKLFPGYYFTGDAAKKDADGHCRLMGKIGDATVVSCGRVGTVEVERALCSHPAVAEAAVIGIPHAVKGQGIYALVTLKNGIKSSEDLREELLTHSRRVIGPMATPDMLGFAEVLPRRSDGKTMRRILGKIAEERIEKLGGTSTDSRELHPLVPSRTKERSGWDLLTEDHFQPNIDGSLFYHPGHTWVKVEEADEVRVGLDGFVGRIIGNVEMIVLPLRGRRCLQGESLCSLIQEKGILNLVFPLSGLILSVNERLKDEPELITEDPLGEGFLLTLKPSNLQGDQKRLFSGESAADWYQKELDRFKGAVIPDLIHSATHPRSGSTLSPVERLTPGRNGVGMTMQDGQIRLEEIKRFVDAEQYIWLVNRFLRKGEKSSL